MSKPNGRHIRLAILDIRPLLRGTPKHVARLAWDLHCARNLQSPRAAKIERDLLDTLDCLGIVPPIVSIDVCPTCGQDLPRSEVAS